MCNILIGYAKLLSVTYPVTYLHSTPVFTLNSRYIEVEETVYFVRYKECNINVLKALGKIIHFNISDRFVISEFDRTGVDCIILICIQSPNELFIIR